jgi:hypothetical protein
MELVYHNLLFCITGIVRYKNTIIAISQREKEQHETILKYKQWTKLTEEENRYVQSFLLELKI